MIIMVRTLLMIPALLIVFGMGFAYAEPLDNANTAVLNYDGVSASIEIEWNFDETVTKYDIGCVSCMPNTLETTSGSNIALDGVTPFPNTSKAMLYIIAYDSNDEIINAKQILVSLE